MYAVTEVKSSGCRLGHQFGTDLRMRSSHRVTAVLESFAFFVPIWLMHEAQFVAAGIAAVSNSRHDACSGVLRKS